MTSTHPDTSMTAIPEARCADQQAAVPTLPWVTGTATDTADLDAAKRRVEAAERRLAALERALTTRAGIDQAKGAIMATFALTAESAFEVLIWVSQHSNVKLAVVAERFLEELHGLDLGQPPREQLTRVLAALAGCDPTCAGGLQSVESA